MANKLTSTHGEEHLRKESVRLSANFWRFILPGANNPEKAAKVRNALDQCERETGVIWNGSEYVKNTH